MTRLMRWSDTSDIFNKTVLTTKEHLARQYLLTFLVWIMGFGLLLILGMGEYLQHSIAETQAILVASILDMGGIQVVRMGQLLVLEAGAISVSIAEPCTGLYLSMTLLVSIMALPAAMKRKLTMALVALMILQMVNTLRITHLILMLKYHHVMFDFVHIVIWQVLMLGLSIILLVSTAALQYKSISSVVEDESATSSGVNTSGIFGPPVWFKYGTAFILCGLLVGVVFAGGDGAGSEVNGGPTTIVPVSTLHPLYFIIIFGLVALQSLKRSR